MLSATFCQNNKIQGMENSTIFQNSVQQLELGCGM